MARLVGLMTEIRAVGPGDADALARFFEVLKAGEVSEHFHPHPLTAEMARERASYSGEDLYFVLLRGIHVLGYAMLRGWDEGYEVPSLGIVVHPEARRQGLGRQMMNFLRAAALKRGARKIRLRVHPDNMAAVALYRSLGYELARETEGRYLVGVVDLKRR